MAEHTIVRTQQVPGPRSEVFEFFANAANLERITPPELNFQIITPQPIAIGRGTLIDYRLRLRGIPINWKTEITQWNPPVDFVDTALKSPYRQWIHLHTFEETAGGGTLMTDLVRYRLPLEPFGDLAHFIVRRELDYIFEYRRKIIADIFTGTTASNDGSAAG